MHADVAVLRFGGVALFALACACSLAANGSDGAAANAAGDGMGWEALLGVIAFTVACFALVTLHISAVKARRLRLERKRAERRREG